MGEAKSYMVTCRREGAWWALEVPEVPGAFTQAANVVQIPYMAAEAIELITGELPERLRLVGDDVVQAFTGPPSYQAIVERPDTLAAALQEGFEPAETSKEAESARLAVGLRRHGRWTCTVEGSSAVICNRVERPL